MLDTTSTETDRVRHCDPRARAVRDDHETVQSEEVTAAVGLRIEPLSKLPRAGSYEQAAESPSHGRAELGAQRVEQRLDRPLQCLQRDVSREPVRDDDIRAALEQEPALHVPLEVKVGRTQELVGLDR